MKSTIIVCSHNRPIQEQTRAIISQMMQAGAALVVNSGTADVTLARNIALTGACQKLRVLNEQRAKTQLLVDPPRPLAPAFDTFLMVDDDMVFTLDEAQEIVNYTRTHAVAASGAYCTSFGTMASKPLQQAIGEKRRWLTGLGLMAIPAWMILKIEETAEEFTLSSGQFKAFTTSSSRGGKWYSEDFELCARLGGVHLLPIAIGHLKTVPLYPDAETIEKIRGNIPLPAQLSEAELDSIEPSRMARNADGGRG